MPGLIARKSGGMCGVRGFARSDTNEGTWVLCLAAKSVEGKVNVRANKPRTPHLNSCGIHFTCRNHSCKL